MNYVLLFSFLRRKKRAWTKTNAGLSQAEVDEFNAVIAEAEGKSPLSPDKQDKLGSKVGPLVAIVGTIAATSLFATVPQHEGTEYKAYRDIAGVWTICQGDTANVRPGLIETPEGCRQRLERQLVAHASGVMACTPRLKDGGRDWQRAAAVSLAYNIGVGAYCKSTVDRRFDAGDWKAGCDAMLAWNKARIGGQLRPVLGLTRRRQEERTLCLKDIA